jgi:ATP-dependent helicase HrpA
MNFRVLDESDTVVGSGRDLESLQVSLKPAVQSVVSYANRGMERVGLTEFPSSPIPRRVEELIGEHLVPGWPALVDRGATVDLRVFTSETEQENEMRLGALRLLTNEIEVPTRYIVGVLTNAQKLALASAPHTSVHELILDAHRAVLSQSIDDAGGVPWSAEEFADIVAAARDRIGDRVLAVVRKIASILELSSQVSYSIEQISTPALAGLRADMTAQLKELLPASFVTSAGVSRLDDLVRYLRAMAIRLEAAPRDSGRDALRQQHVDQVIGEWHEIRDRLPKHMRAHTSASEIDWMIQELRVNLFAQKMGTKFPVSDKRIYRAMDALIVE